MYKFKEKLDKLFKSINIKKENIIPFIASIGITFLFFLVFYYFSKYFVNVIWIFDGILLVFLVLTIMTIAGFAVLKSLFLVAAELSLLIFLAQSYCAVPKSTVTADEALKNLLAFGILYIIISFFRSLFEVLKKNYKYIENEKWSVNKIISISLYLIFTVIFIRNIYLVMHPIILDLCVYK